MSQILQNIASIEWWFTGVFFILLGIFISKLVQSWIPNSIEKFRRRKRRYTLIQVKKCRQHAVKVHFMTVRYWSLASAIILCFMLIGLFYVISPPETLKSNIGFWIVLTAAYLLTVYMDRERELIGEIIDGHVAWVKRK